MANALRDDSKPRLFITTTAVVNGEEREVQVPVVEITGTLTATVEGAGDASAAKQDTGNTTLGSILAKLTADPATQTTLAAVLAKIIAAPATEAKQPALVNGRSQVVLTDTSNNPIEPHADDDTVIYIAGVSYTVKRLPIAIAATDDVVPLVSAKKIRVIFAWLTSAGAVNVKWQSNSTDLTGLEYIDAAGRGLVLPPNPYGWCETVAGEALNLNLSGSVAVGGVVGYIEV